MQDQGRRGKILMKDVLVYIGVTMLGVGIAVLFSIAMAAIRQRRLDEQAKRFGYGHDPALAGLDADEVDEVLDVRRELRLIMAENATLAELARGPSNVRIVTVSAVTIGWLMFCKMVYPPFILWSVCITATWFALRRIALAIYS
jgi:hypothetical protein